LNNVQQSDYVGMWGGNGTIAINYKKESILGLTRNMAASIFKSINHLSYFMYSIRRNRKILLRRNSLKNATFYKKIDLYDFPILG